MQVGSDTCPAVGKRKKEEGPNRDTDRIRVYLVLRKTSDRLARGRRKGVLPPREKSKHQLGKGSSQAKNERSNVGRRRQRGEGCNSVGQGAVRSPIHRRFEMALPPSAVSVSLPAGLERKRYHASKGQKKNRKDKVRKRQKGRV